jgi:hypothetical protein
VGALLDGDAMATALDHDLAHVRAVDHGAS